MERITGRKRLLIFKLMGFSRVKRFSGTASPLDPVILPTSVCKLRVDCLIFHSHFVSRNSVTLHNWALQESV